MFSLESRVHFIGTERWAGGKITATLSANARMSMLGLKSKAGRDYADFHTFASLQ